jgi:hypothetical protein
LDHFCGAAPVAFHAAPGAWTDPKIIADQQGHGLGVHLSDYVDSSLARKQEASSALWADFKVLQSVPASGN